MGDHPVGQTQIRVTAYQEMDFVLVPERAQGSEQVVRRLTQLITLVAQAAAVNDYAHGSILTSSSR